MQSIIRLSLRPVEKSTDRYEAVISMHTPFKFNRSRSILLPAASGRIDKGWMVVGTWVSFSFRPSGIFVSARDLERRNEAQVTLL